jgi:hypothetical protein
VGGLGITFSGANGAVAGLAFAPDGTLFAALGNQTESRLYRVNKTTGAGSLVGSIGYGGVSGIRFFVPPPGPIRISRQTGQFRVSFPHERGGKIETATSVTGFWNSATAPLSTNGAEAFSLFPNEGGARFFRLRN